MTRSHARLPGAPMKPWMVADWYRTSVPSRVKNGNWLGIYSRQPLVNRRLLTAGQMEGALPESHIVHKIYQNLQDGWGFPWLGTRAHIHTQTECNKQRTFNQEQAVPHLVHHPKIVTVHLQKTDQKECGSPAALCFTLR